MNCHLIRLQGDGMTPHHSQIIDAVVVFWREDKCLLLYSLVVSDVSEEHHVSIFRVEE
jgi:hypothetical protein